MILGRLYNLGIISALLFITSCSKETAEKGDCLLVEVIDEYSLVFEKYYCNCGDKSKITKIEWNKLGASKYEFDYQNNKIIGANVEIAFSGVPSPPLPVKENYVYNESGLLMEIPNHKYEYNNNNQLIKEYIYINDSIYEYKIFNINKNGPARLNDSPPLNFLRVSKTVPSAASLTIASIESLTG